MEKRSFVFLRRIRKVKILIWLLFVLSSFEGFAEGDIDINILPSQNPFTISQGGEINLTWFYTGQPGWTCGLGIGAQVEFNMEYYLTNIATGVTETIGSNNVHIDSPDCSYYWAGSPMNVIVDIPCSVATGNYYLSCKINDFTFYQGSGDPPYYSVRATNLVNGSNQYCNNIDCTLNNVAQINISTAGQVAVSATSTSVSCNGDHDGTALATATGAGTYTYHWSNGSTLAEMHWLYPGTYTVTAYDACNSTNNATTSVAVSEPQPLSINIASTNFDCSSYGTATATVSGGTPGYSYSWSNGSSTPSISNLEAGNYTLEVTDNNDCIANEQVTIVSVAPLSLPDGLLSNPHLENISTGKPDNWYASNSSTDPANLSLLPAANILPVFSGTDAAPGDGCKGADLPMNTSSLLPTYLVQKSLSGIPVSTNKVYMMEVRIKTANTAPLSTKNYYDVDVIAELTGTGRKYDLKKVYSLNSSDNNTTPPEWETYRIMFSTEKYYGSQKLHNIGLRFYTEDPQRSNIMAHADAVILDNVTNIISFKAPDGSEYNLQSLTAGSATSTGNYLGTTVSFIDKTAHMSEFSGYTDVNKVFQLEQKSTQLPGYSNITRYNYDDTNDMLVMGNIVLQPFTHLNIVNSGSVMFDQYILDQQTKIPAKIWLGTGSALTVSSGGKLKYNKGDINLMASDAGIGIVDGTLEVMQNATLRLNTGYLEVMPAGTLDLKQGSTLAFDAGSRFIIEAGNTIDIGTGSNLLIGGRANLELNNNCILNILAGSVVDIKSDAVAELKTSCKINVEAGGTLYIRSNSLLKVGSSSVIHVKTGASAYIYSTAWFAQNSIIIVEPGGKLYINGGELTTPSGANYLWKGIVVKGNSSASQSLNYQGFVQLKNEAIIANALIGIDVQTGGVVSAQVSSNYGANYRTSCTFLDNQIGVRFNTSVYYAPESVSKFTNSIFKWEGALNNPSLLPVAHVEIYNIDGIDFIGCDFIHDESRANACLFYCFNPHLGCSYTNVNIPFSCD